MLTLDIVRFLKSRTRKCNYVETIYKILKLKCELHVHLTLKNRKTITVRKQHKYFKLTSLIRNNMFMQMSSVCVCVCVCVCESGGK